MLRIQKKTGFSLAEVLIASIIFLLAAAGLFASFSKSRQSSERVDQRLQAAYIGRQVLDELRAKVDSRNWDAVGSALEPGTHSNIIDGFNVTYAVTDNAGGISGLRKLTMNITW